MFPENLDEFLDTSEFAESITVAGQAWVVVWDAPYAEDLDIGGRAFQAQGKEATLPAGTGPGTVVVRLGLNYKVKGTPQPDGTGLVTLQLELS